MCKHRQADAEEEDDSEEEEEEEDHGHPSDKPLPYKRSIPVCASDEAQFDVQKPHFFPADHKGAGQVLGSLPAAMGQARIQDGIASCSRFATEQRQLTSLLRMPPKGAPADSVEALKWVPQDFKENGHQPEALRQHGSPWVLFSAAGGARTKANQFPSTGIAAYIRAIEGRGFLAIWPVEAGLNLGSTVEDTHDLLTAMAPKAFETWSESHVQHAELTPGQAVWIPYGWQCILIAAATTGQPEPDRLAVLYAPFINGQLASACPQKGGVISYTAEFVRRQMAAGNKPWVNLGQQYLEWLRSVDAEAASAGQGAVDEEEDVD